MVGLALAIVVPICLTITICVIGYPIVVEWVDNRRDKRRKEGRY